MKNFFMFFLILLFGLFSSVDQAGAECNLNPEGLTIVGNPESVLGATWTYTSTDNGIFFNLNGVLIKPQGAGPFPGAIVSHGYIGSPSDMVDVAREMRNWGMVVINPVYTHAIDDTGNAPTGDAGASSENILRAHKAWDILCSLGYVDMRRIAAHGHSAGAYVTTAVLDAYPSDFKVGSHTGGGTNGCTSYCGFFPERSERDSITVPYSLHHGDQDSTVPLSYDQALYSELQGYGVTTELRIYTGLTHSDVRYNSNVLANIRQWYSTYGMFTDTVPPLPPRGLTIMQ
jgi:dienelactone hydrolase